MKKLLVLLVVVFSVLACNSSKEKEEVFSWEYKTDYVAIEKHNKYFYVLKENCNVEKIDIDKNVIWKVSLNNPTTEQTCLSLAVNNNELVLGGSSLENIDGELKDFRTPNLLMLNPDTGLVIDNYFGNKAEFNYTNSSVTKVTLLHHGYLLFLGNTDKGYRMAYANIDNPNGFMTDNFKVNSVTTFNDGYFMMGYSNQSDKVEGIKTQYNSVNNSYTRIATYNSDSEDFIQYTSMLVHDGHVYAVGTTEANVADFNKGYTDVVVTKLTVNMEFVKNFQFGGSGVESNPQLFVDANNQVTVVTNTDSPELGSEGMMDVSLTTLTDDLTIDSTEVYSVNDDIELDKVFFDTDGLYISGTVDGSGFVSQLDY